MGVYVIHGGLSGISPERLTDRQIHNCIMDSHDAINRKAHINPAFITDSKRWGIARDSIHGIIFDFSNIGLTIKRIQNGLGSGSGLETATDIETFFTFSRAIFDQAAIHFVSLFTLSGVDKSFSELTSFKSLKNLDKKDFFPEIKPFLDAFIALQKLRGLFIHNGKTPTIFGSSFGINCKLPTELQNIQLDLGVSLINNQYSFPIEKTIKYFTSQTLNTLNALGKILNKNLYKYIGTEITCNTAIEGENIPSIKILTHNVANSPTQK